MSISGFNALNNCQPLEYQRLKYCPCNELLDQHISSVTSIQKHFQNYKLITNFLTFFIKWNMALAKILSTVMGVGEEQQAMDTGNTAPTEQEEALSMEELAAKVEQATLENVKKNAHSSLTEVNKGWNSKGKMGDNCPKVLMATPCAVPDHKPVPGKGFFCLLGDRLAQTRSETVNSEPEKALEGPKGCGYLGCKSSFFDSLGCCNNDYPQVLKCQARMKNHDVNWPDPDDIGCAEHADFPYWSHLLMTVKILLIWLEKQIQRKFRTHPGSFPVCKTGIQSHRIAHAVCIQRTCQLGEIGRFQPG